jgi:hypothetical protein
VPDVLAAGGVFLDQNGALHGSDYASGYKSPLVRSRNRAHGLFSGTSAAAPQIAGRGVCPGRGEGEFDAGHGKSSRFARHAASIAAASSPMRQRLRRLSVLDCDKPHLRGLVWHLRPGNIVRPRDGRRHRRDIDLNPIPTPYHCTKTLKARARNKTIVVGTATVAARDGVPASPAHSATSTEGPVVVTFALVW